MADLNLNEIEIKAKVASKPLRDNFTDITSYVNDLQSQIDNLATPPAGTEVTLARDYHTVLRDRLRSASKTTVNTIISGGVVSINGGDAQKVDVTAGEAVIDGVACVWANSISGTIAYTVANTRYDVVVINSDSTLSVVGGTASADPILPSVSATQKALWVLTVGTASVALGWDARNQGAVYMHDGLQKYTWKIQDAVDDITNGDMDIGIGNYYEEINLLGKSNITLYFRNGAKVYRMNSTSYCIKSDNASGSETSNTKIINAQLYGNGKAGSCELLYTQYADQLEIVGCYFDGNASSTATYKNFVIDYCDRIHLDNNLPIKSGVIDYTSTNITNSTELLEDGRMTGETIFCGTTAQKSVMLKRGWSEFTAMNGYFPLVNNTTAGTTAAAAAHSHSLNAGVALIGFDESTASIDILEIDIGSWTSNKKRGGSASSSAGGSVSTDVVRLGGDTDTTTPPNPVPSYTLIALIHR